MHSNTSAQRFIVSAENISFMQLFTTIAHALNKKPPRFTPPRYAAELLWRILELQYKFTKKTPIITKETVESAYQTSLYSNEKIRTALQYNFIPINQTIEWVAQDFLKNRMD
jgi:nucleoside-diphosphate-sugar epimerase